LYFHNVAGTLIDVCIDENQKNKSFIFIIFSDGSWSQWTEFGSCSHRCEGGIALR